MIAAELYIHYYWADAQSSYSFLQELKGEAYQAKIISSLNAQKAHFVQTRAKAGLMGSKKEINQFLKETNYGKTIVENLNMAMEGIFHGFTAALEYMEGQSLSDFAYMTDKEIARFIQQKLNANINPMQQAASTIRSLYTDIDDLMIRLGDYILSLLEQENISQDEYNMIKQVVQVADKTILIIPENISVNAQTAIKDYNRFVKDATHMEEIASQFSIMTPTRVTSNSKAVKGFRELNLLANTFGGFIGEVAVYVGIYKAMSDPKLKQSFKTISDVFHTGGMNNLTGVFQTMVKLTEDPKFKQFLEDSARLADNKTLKDDVEFLIQNSHIQGTMGINVKNAGMLDTKGKVRQQQMITLDSSNNFSQIIKEVTSGPYATLSTELGEKDFYYNLAAGLPYERRGKRKTSVGRGVAELWNNYKRLIVTGNTLTAIMGRLNQEKISAGNNSMIFCLNGKFYTVYDILNSLITAASNGKFYINAQRSNTGSGLHKSKAENINKEEFLQGPDSADHDLAKTRSAHVASRLESEFFSQKIQTKINLAAFLSI